MTTRFSDHAPRVRAVSSPGGPPRQYRVQYQQPDSQLWHVAGCYRRREDAEAALEELHRQGVPARLVEYRYCAAA